MIGLHGTSRAARVLLACLLAAGCAEPPPDGIGRVVDVADGDTVVVRLDGDDVRIRIFGVDAPESDQAYGAESREFTRRLLLGQDVAVRTRDVDQYGRTVAALSVDGVDVGATLLAEGAAWHYRAFSSDARYADLEAAARQAGTGLWRDDAAVPPWTWRTAERRTHPYPGQRAGSVETAFVGNRRSQVFHARGCPDFACANCNVAFGTAAAATAAGYRPHSCVRETIE